MSYTRFNPPAVHFPHLPPADAASCRLAAWRGWPPSAPRYSRYARWRPTKP